MYHVGRLFGWQTLSTTAQHAPKHGKAPARPAGLHRNDRGKPHNTAPMPPVVLAARGTRRASAGAVSALAPGRDRPLVAGWG